MRKINTNNMEELVWSSPKGKFVGAGKQVSEALGRKPLSTDLMERHPFDVEICRIPPGKAAYPYHTHSAQWEFYHIISGHGIARHKDGKTSIEPGDAFIFGPNEPHQLHSTAILAVRPTPKAFGVDFHRPGAGQDARLPHRLAAASPSCGGLEARATGPCSNRRSHSKRDR
ncbi:MAG: cupin domain-containing protein [Verrucomicrobia bacterium]|nr:MAG: cupin domain-containing protein [Verrucomicrobiota bacterium]